MKKSFCALLAGAILAVSGCGGSPTGESSEEIQLAEKGELMEYTSYNLEAWLRPFWNTREVYNETVLFVGERDEARLMYKPAHILSVRNYGLDKEYVNGRDYALTEEGKIRRLPDSGNSLF